MTTTDTTPADLRTDAERYRDIAERAVSLLVSVGCYGLDRSKERELWQRGLDLNRELHPSFPRQVVWTAGEGDVIPARQLSGDPATDRLAQAAGEGAAA